MIENVRPVMGLSVLAGAERILFKRWRWCFALNQSPLDDLNIFLPTWLRFDPGFDLSLSFKQKKTYNLINKLAVHLLTQRHSKPQPVQCVNSLATNNMRQRLSHYAGTPLQLQDKHSTSCLLCLWRTLQWQKWLLKWLSVYEASKNVIMPPTRIACGPNKSH